jgi:hypothetical protein
MAWRKKNLKISKGQSEYHIEEEQTTQWSKEKVQRDKQRSTKHTYKAIDGVTQTPLQLLTWH